MKNEIKLSSELFGETINVSATVFPSGTSSISKPGGGSELHVAAARGIHVLVTGGQLPHLGAISIISPEGELSTTQFPSHKDSFVSEKWAKSLQAAGFLPVAAAAGIHYDNLSKEQIKEIVAVTDELLEELLDKARALS